jgi:hypothetical protein
VICWARGECDIGHHRGGRNAVWLGADLLLPAQDVRTSRGIRVAAGAAGGTRERVQLYPAALTEFRRGQLDWYNRRQEDPDSAMTLAARVESYRLRGVAQTALSQVQLVASAPALVVAADEAYELARPVHRAQDSAAMDARSERAKKAVDRFIALAAAELQSAPIADPNPQ